MQNNYNPTHYRTWQAAVAATRAMLIQRGYSPDKAQKCALDRNIAANMDVIQGGAA